MSTTAVATSRQQHPRFYYVKEVATELRRTEASVRWMLHIGQLKGGKIGGRTVIPAEEVDRVIAEAFGD